MGFEAAFNSEFVALAAAIMLLAGLVKGLVGFAFPMVALAGLASVAPALDAIALTVFPAGITNWVQAFGQGRSQAFRVGRLFWRLNALMFVLLLVVAQVTPFIPSAAMYIGLGVVVTASAVAQLIGWRPTLAAPDAPRAQAVIGGACGVVGGLTGVWGPIVVNYYLARRTERSEQITALGVNFALGWTVLAPAHVLTGALNAATASLSLLLCAPALLGMSIGARFRNRINAEWFRTATLIVLCVAGLNLLRRAVI